MLRTEALCARYGLFQALFDVSIAVAWGFTQLVASDVINAAAYPHLAAFSARAEQHPDFAALPPV